MADEVEDAGPVTKPVFKVADHEVAGHRFEYGRVGPLIDDSHRFYKPLQDGARGDKEVTLYKRIWFHDLRCLLTMIYATIRLKDQETTSEALGLRLFGMQEFTYATFGVYDQHRQEG